MFGFGRKKKIEDTGLLKGMTDIHAHLLSGVDDGSPNEQETNEALHLLSDIGVSRLYLTPHIMSEYPENNRSFLSGKFEQLRQRNTSGIELRLAAEYMLDTGFYQHLKEGLLTMRDKHVLVETSYLSPPPEFENMLYQLFVEGYQPIIAHPERYRYMKPETYFHLKERGYKFQMNLFSLSGYYGMYAKENAAWLLKQGLYDFVGSDIHSPQKYQRGLKDLRLNTSSRNILATLLKNNESLW